MTAGEHIQERALQQLEKLSTDTNDLNELYRDFIDFMGNCELQLEYQEYLFKESLGIDSHAQ